MSERESATRPGSPSGIVGIIVNPQAGKDIRRLASAASHTSDVAKMGIVRRAAVGAIEAGARRVLLSADRNNLSARSIDGIDPGSATLELLDSPGTGSRHDTIAAARTLREVGASAVIVLGGDGTCRDAAVGWPDMACVAISTGTNNVFPISVDATSAGLAAGLVAIGAVCIDGVSQRAKRIVVDGVVGGELITDVALVDMALIDTVFVGARAVQTPATIRSVFACIAEPARTGLSGIGGRLLPTSRTDAGGVFVELGANGTPLRAPISPGSFSTVGVLDARRVQPGEQVHFHGPGVLAFDGERHVRLESGDQVVAQIDSVGPRVINVDQALRQAVTPHSFPSSEHLSSVTTTAPDTPSTFMKAEH